jgi:hypothetical protein
MAKSSRPRFSNMGGNNKLSLPCITASISAKASSSDLMNEPDTPAIMTDISPVQVPRLTTIPGRAMIVSHRPCTAAVVPNSIICISPRPCSCGVRHSDANCTMRCDPGFLVKIQSHDTPSFSLRRSSATALSFDLFLPLRRSDVHI